jgi:hypothetical protein
MATELATTDALRGTRYAVGKRFIEGPLEGIEIIDRHCPLPFEVGKAYGGTWGSRYVVTSCEEIAS